MSDIAGAFDAHGGFEATDAGYAATANDWTATVRLDDGEVVVTVRVPTLSAAVRDEAEVADVVEDGWFETFELRVEDAPNVTRAESAAAPSVARADGEVAVTVRLAGRPKNAASDALAVVNYVEGTWFEGIVPGYDYRADVQDLRDRAAGRAQASDSI